MKVTINRGRTFSVSIEGGFTGPLINLELSPEDALELLQALDAKRRDLHALVTDYYDCKECGGTHSKSVRVCPNIG